MAVKDILRTQNNAQSSYFLLQLLSIGIQNLDNNFLSLLKENLMQDLIDIGRSWQKNHLSHTSIQQVPLHLLLMEELTQFIIYYPLKQLQAFSEYREQVKKKDIEFLHFFLYSEDLALNYNCRFQLLFQNCFSAYQSIISRAGSLTNEEFNLKIKHYLKLYSQVLDKIDLMNLKNEDQFL